MSRRRIEILIAGALVITAAASGVYALTHQIVLEGTDEANYLQWATRPLFFLSAGGFLLGIVAVVLFAAQVARPLAMVASVACVAVLATGISIAVVRRHPLGHERGILDDFQLPASAGKPTTYDPRLIDPLPGDVEPPEIVATWTVHSVDNVTKCRVLQSALTDLHTVFRAGSGSTGGGGVICVYEGHVRGWPVMAEVDEPAGFHNFYSYEIPARDDEELPSPAPGTLRIDLLIQPPDGN